jgi:hypothetical protein
MLSPLDRIQPCTGRCASLMANNKGFWQSCLKHGKAGMIFSMKKGFLIRKRKRRNPEKKD